MTGANKPFYRISYIILFLFMFMPLVKAQVYTGKVIDAVTKKPVPFTNISFGNGKTGTVTDIDGEFRTSVKMMTNPVIFSCVGYETKRTDIVTLFESNVIMLKPVMIELNSVDVYPGKNPAVGVMKNVIEHLDKHNPDLITDYSCIIYHKLSFTADIPEQVLNRPENVGIKSFLMQSDLMLMESVSEKKHLRPDKTSERLISGKVSGVKDPALSYLPAQLQPFTFYRKYIRLLNSEYLNPVSEQGLRFYTFILTDTLVNSMGDTILYVKFLPKKDRNFNGLKGALHIYKPSWALQTVSAESNEPSGKSRLKIRQNYRLVNDSVWFPFQLESNLILNNFKMGNGTSPFPVVASGKSYVTAVNLNPDVSVRDFNNVTFRNDLYKHDAPPVDVFRYEPLTHKDSVTYMMLDSIGNVMKLDRFIEMQKAVVKGEIPWGVIDIDYRKIFDYNGFEGFKLGLGLWTNKRMSGLFSVGGYYQYGFKSEKSNFGAGFNITPGTDPDLKLSFLYKDDVYATGTYRLLDGYRFRSPESFRRFLFETMDYTKEFDVSLRFRWVEYIKTSIGFRYASITPQKEYRFMMTPDTVPAFDTKELVVKLKWANKETFADTPFGRVSNGTSWPVVWLNFTYGDGSNDSESFNYVRCEAQIHKKFKLNPSNITTLRLTAGAISGDLPYTLLYSAFGSYKTVGLEIPYALATMRLNEFAADRFAIFNFKHKILLLQNRPGAFKPEIILDTNAAVSDGPEGLYTFSKGYYESGIFFNNLFRQLIARYGFAVHYRYGPYRFNKDIDNWAFNIGVEFMF
ncbi:MAG: carboxypeptidase-like regulatory domain-containing protein [Chlorobi bacterium]|nr:carboxypeptidase-like regulatory domain-containing protein [Chlorobiota bacterium]